MAGCSNPGRSSRPGFRSTLERLRRTQDLKLEIDQLSRKEAVEAARYRASVVGHAQARQMDTAARHAWARELGRSRHVDGLDAPS